MIPERGLGWSALSSPAEITAFAHIAGLLLSSTRSVGEALSWRMPQVTGGPRRTTRVQPNTANRLVADTASTPPPMADPSFVRWSLCGLMVPPA